MHKRVPHLQVFHRACASYYKALCCFLSFFLFLFLSFSFFFFSLSFSLAFSCANNYTMSLYEIAHTTVARNTTRYQMCKAQAIIDELVSIGQGNRKDSGSTKGVQVGKRCAMFIPFRGDLHPLFVDIPPLSWNFGWIICNEQRHGDVELVLSFPTQLESPKTESESQSYDQNGEAAEAVGG